MDSVENDSRVFPDFKDLFGREANLIRQTGRINKI